jgi:hypothetical protein
VSTCPEKRPLLDLKAAWRNGDPGCQCFYWLLGDEPPEHSTASWQRLDADGRTVDTHVICKAEERRTIHETPKTAAELEQLKQIEDVLRGRGELRELRRSGLR